MRIPLSWLRDALARIAGPAPFPADALQTEAVVATLTRLGFEVEEVARVAPGLETVITGRITAAEKHPNADKLRVCQTDVGGPEPLQIVTGAANVQVGDVIPVAQVGSLLPGNKAINAAKLRGVESFGMYCSLVELGLPPGVDGVHVLPPDTPLGRPIAEVMGLGEEVLVLAVTANRADGLCVAGIAREIAAAHGRSAAYVVTAPDEALAAFPDGGATPAEVVLADPDLCPRYVAQVIEGVKVGPSPDWLRRRLDGVGVRSINNVVDVTNLVLMEWGQPLHAFDLDRLDGPLTARRATAAEAIRTLDGQDWELAAGTLVIADRSGPQAIAGVMGGHDSQVTADTSRILLEAAYFKPTSVRTTAKRLGLASESSYRFERGVDPANVHEASRYAARLIAGLGGGRIVGTGVDQKADPAWPQLPVVPYRAERRAALLGATTGGDPDDRALLTALGFELAEGSYRTPGWRFHDVTREVDLVEEVARTFGYERFAEEPLPLEAPVADRPEERLLARVRATLTGAGLAEVSTASLLPPDRLHRFGADPASIVTLANPLAGMEALRTLLVPGLLEVAAHNARQGQADGGIYEVGRTYRFQAGSEGPVIEALRVAGVQWGAVGTGLWKEAPAAFQADFAWGRGLLETLLAALRLPAPVLVPTAPGGGDHPGQAAEVRVAGRRVGRLGAVHPAIAADHDLPAAVAFELELDALRELASFEAPCFRPFPRTPAIVRDLALTVPEDLEAARVVDAALRAGGTLVEDVRPFDRYAGPQVPAGHVSLGLSVRYRAADRTLTEAELSPVHDRVVDELAREFGAQLRG